MGFFDLISALLGGGSDGGSRTVYRQKSGRYGKRGQYRKARNGDFKPRGPNGRYQK